MSVQTVGSQSQTPQGSGSVWITKPFRNWRKAVQKMKAHTSSESHMRYLEAELTAKKVDQLKISYNALGKMSQPKTKMPSSLSFHILISYSNNTFLTQLTLTS